MVGTTPLVSISERRLGGIAYSSLPCFCAIRALELSTSRIVKPNCSRNARRFCPPENMGPFPERAWITFQIPETLESAKNCTLFGLVRMREFTNANDCLFAFCNKISGEKLHSMPFGVEEPFPRRTRPSNQEARQNPKSRSNTAGVPA